MGRPSLLSWYCTMVTIFPARAPLRGRFVQEPHALSSINRGHVSRGPCAAVVGQLLVPLHRRRMTTRWCRANRSVEDDLART